MTTTIIHCGEFGRRLASAVASRQPDGALRMLALAQFRAEPQVLQGQVFLLCSSLRLDLMREAERALAPSAILTSCFAFERHVLLASASSPDGVCAHCFGKRFLSQPPAPYSAEAIWLLARLASEFEDLQFHGYHPGLVGVASQLCLLQAAGDIAAGTSVLVDIGRAHSQSNRIAPVHGCLCRDASRRTCAGAQRFAAFDREIAAWIA